MYPSEHSMNAPANGFLEADRPSCLFVSSSGPALQWLSMALIVEGVVVPVSPDPRALEERIGALSPLAVFLDFSGVQALAAVSLHQRIKRGWPNLPVLATGSAAEPAAMLAALRAGVDDFVDTQASPAEALRALRALLDKRQQPQEGARGKTLALLGARVGMGVTTFAASLALCLQDLRGRAAGAQAGRTTGRGVALLDLGLPERDGLLYLDTASEFSFSDAVRNFRRLDQTLLQSAVSHHSSGLAVLPLPAGQAQAPAHDISQPDSLALIRRLGSFFDYQVADLGGAASVDFIAATARSSDLVWLVCDQSTGGIVSTAQLLKELRARGLENERMGLVVNRFESKVALSARDIAERLELPLRHVLPARGAQLLGAASRGEMLVRSHPADAYSQAVSGIARQLQQEWAGEPAQAKAGRPGGLLSQIAGSWNKPKER
jgi:pilus assembly protein CpaE